MTPPRFAPYETARRLSWGAWRLYYLGTDNPVENAPDFTSCYAARKWSAEQYKTRMEQIA